MWVWCRLETWTGIQFVHRPSLIAYWRWIVSKRPKLNIGYRTPRLWIVSESYIDMYCSQRKKNVCGSVCLSKHFITGNRMKCLISLSTLKHPSVMPADHLFKVFWFMDDKAWLMVHITIYIFVLTSLYKKTENSNFSNLVKII